MQYTTTLHRVTHAAAALCLGITLASTAQAQQPEPEPKPEPPSAEETRQEAWCGHRPPINAVLAYDAGKNFNAVTDRAVRATEAFTKTLCPGDVVRVSEFGLTARWLGDVVRYNTAGDARHILQALKTRKRPAATASVNELVAKLAVAHWEEHLEQGQMPTLVVFTDTIESSAPRSVFVVDFPWNAIPSYFEGRFLTLVHLLERRSAAEDGTIYVTSEAKAFSATNLPSGGRTTYAKIMAAFIPPPPPPPEPEPRVIVKTVAEDNTPRWIAWLVTTEGSLAAGGLFFLLGILLFAAGRRSRRNAKPKAPSQAPGEDRFTPHTVTLTVHDNIEGQRLKSETRSVAEVIRIAPASNADFVIPGPYAFEIVNDGGAQPLIRSDNMLGLELRRGGERRRITLASGETAAIFDGDRVDIGAGVEVEIQLSQMGGVS